MSTIDEDVEFAQSGDDGENTNNSIQPLCYAGTSEFNDPASFNRPFQNLRRRTEVLRGEIRDLKYLSDYDRGLVMWSPGTVQMVTQSGEAKIVMTDELVITPALGPGARSGGRALGAKLFIGNNNYAGTYGVNDLSIVASGDHTGQRGYADGTSMADAGVLSVGGNNITVELAGENRAGGAGSIRATVTGTPRRHIKITYGTQAPGITIAQLISAINGDETLFGTEAGFGLRHMIYASSSTVGASTTIPDFAKTKLKGGYDAEVHTVTAAQMAAFFSASTDNLLQDGDALAIGYPVGLVESGTETLGAVWSSLGGRRQSILDAPTDRTGSNIANTGASATYGNLFNTARQPELIPGSIPIGRRVGNEFIFVDGTKLLLDAAAISLSESYVTVARITALQSAIYAAFAATTGAALVGYAGSDQWHAGTADDGTATLSLPATTLEAGLDAVVTQLSSRTLNSSGSRRVGGEALTGTATSENTALSLTALSVRGQLALILNGTAGLNQRVYESGHRMVTANPLYKDFRNADSRNASGGGLFVRTILNVPTNLSEPGNGTEGGMTGTFEKHSLVLQPLVYDNGGTDVLTASEVADSGATVKLSFSSMAAGKFTSLTSKLPLIVRGGVMISLVVAQITGLSGCVTTDGYFYVTAFNNGTQDISFRNLDGSLTDFDGLSTTPTVTFFTTCAVGSNKLNGRFEAFHYAGIKPFAILGVTSTSAVILEVYTPNGSSGTLQATYWANRFQFVSTRRLDGGAATRDSEDILTHDDKVLLDGVESGTPVDASASHHHDTRYNAMYADIAHEHAYPAYHNLNTRVVDSGLVNDIATTAGGTDFAVALTGFNVVGVVVFYDVIIVPVGAVSTSTSLTFHGANTHTNIDFVLPIAYEATGVGDVRRFTGVITLPVESAAYAVTLAAAGSFDVAASTFSFTQTAIFGYPFKYA